jgi:hypothetical protein
VVVVVDADTAADTKTRTIKKLLFAYIMAIMIPPISSRLPYYEYAINHRSTSSELELFAMSIEAGINHCEMRGTGWNADSINRNEGQG